MESVIGEQLRRLELFVETGNTTPAAMRLQTISHVAEHSGTRCHGRFQEPRGAPPYVDFAAPASTLRVNGPRSPTTRGMK